MSDTAVIEMPGNTTSHQPSPHLKRGTNICGCHLGGDEIKALVVSGAVVLSAGVGMFLMMYVLGYHWIDASPYLGAMVAGVVLLIVGIAAKKRALREYHALPMDHEDRVRYGGSTHPTPASQPDKPAYTAASPHAASTDDPPPSYDQIQ